MYSINMLWYIEVIGSFLSYVFDYFNTHSPIPDCEGDGLGPRNDHGHHYSSCEFSTDRIVAMRA